MLVGLQTICTLLRPVATHKSFESDHIILSSILWMAKPNFDSNAKQFHPKAFDVVLSLSFTMCVLGSIILPYGQTISINRNNRDESPLDIAAGFDDLWIICADNGGPQSARMQLQYAWMQWFTVFHFAKLMAVQFACLLLFIFSSGGEKLIWIWAVVMEL